MAALAGRKFYVATGALALVAALFWISPGGGRGGRQHGAHEAGSSDSHLVDSRDLSPSDEGPHREDRLPALNLPVDDQSDEGFPLSCLAIAGHEERLACYRERLSAVQDSGDDMAAFLAEILCPRVLRGEDSVELLTEALLLYRNKDFFGLLGALRAHCPGFRVQNPILGAVLGLYLVDDDFARAVRSELTTELMFNSSVGEMAILVAEKVASHDEDVVLAQMLDDGALGKFGGTAEQIAYAVRARARTFEDPADALGLVDRVILSKNRPPSEDSAAMGATLASMATHPDVVSVNSVDDVARVLVSLLEDSIFGTSACAQVVNQMSRENAPGAMPIETWEEIFDYAKALRPN